MKRIELVGVTLVLLLAPIGVACGQCSNGFCEGFNWAVQSEARRGASENSLGPLATMKWVWPTDGTKDQVYLYRGGVQIGGWNYAEKHYRHYYAHLNVWGPPRASAPVEPPALPKQTSPEPEQDWKTHGVVEDLIGRKDGKECWSISGERASKVQAFGALLDDDSGQLWLLVNGSDAARKKFLNDLASDPSTVELRKRVRIWSVPSDHFSLFDRDTQKPMFDNVGDPSIYLMQPGGEVLYAQNGRKPNDLEALRKADPNYKPTPPPAPPVPPVPPSPDLPAPQPPAQPSKLPISLLLIGGSVATMWYLTRKG